MKHVMLIAMLLVTSIVVTGCPNSDNPTNNTGNSCGTYNGHQLYKDARGCYYYQGTERVDIHSTACSCD